MGTISSTVLFEAAKKKAGQIKLDRASSRRRVSFMGEQPTHRVGKTPQVNPNSSPLVSKTIRNHFDTDK